MTDDALTAFLRERFDDRDRAAHASADRVLHVSAGGDFRQSPAAPGQEPAGPVTWWLAAYEPARELAATSALRHLLDLHTAEFLPRPDRTPAEADTACCAECYGEPHPCTTLRLLAQPYRDHPRYRPEWAPED